MPKGEKSVFVSRNLARLLFAALLCAAVATAQQSPDTPQPQKDKTSSGPRFHLINSFTEVHAGQPTSKLSAKEKFMLANHFLGPFSFLTAAGSAAVSQAANTNKAWGQGAEGYGKRYGAAFTDAAINNYLGVAVFPSLLAQDPRYFSKGSGGFGSRVVYAASRSLVTRGDSGRSQFNMSNVAAAFATGAIGTAYYPDNEREAGDVAVRGAIRMGIGAAWNVLMEFAPDVERKLFHRK